MKEIPLIPLDQHCFELAYIFFELRRRYTHELLQHQASDWLNIAAGLQDIHFDSRRLYSITSGGSIDIDHQLYENARHKNKALVFELIRFDLIWRGLECIENTFRDSGPSGLESYMLRACKNIRNPDGYNMTFRKLKRLARQHGVRFRSSGDRIGRPLDGLKLVSAVRPLFVHCAYAFPFSHQVRLDEGIDPALIQHAARIVLLTMQKILLGIFAEREDRIESWWHQNMRDHPVATHAMLRTMHLQHRSDQI